MLKTLLRKTYLLVRTRLLGITGIFIKRNSVQEEGLKYKSILVYGLRRLGDMVISLPSFESLRKRFPDSLMVIVCTGFNKDLVDERYFNSFLIHPEGIREKIGLLSVLKGYKFDLAIDLTCDYDIFPAFAIYKSGAKMRVGYDIAGRGIFYTRKVPYMPEGKHASTLIMDLIRHVLDGEDVSLEVIPNYEPEQKEIEYAENYLLKKGISRPIIGIHPGGYFQSQIWPVERFAHIIDKIRKERMADIVLFGAGRDEVLIKEIMKYLKSEKPLMIMNEPAKRFAAFIKICDVFVCNNSGPLHLAAAMKVPTVSMTGPTDYKLWHPLGDNNIVLRKEIECSPCNKAVCKDHKCMNLITVEEVFEAVRSQIDKQKNLLRLNP